MSLGLRPLRALVVFIGKKCAGCLMPDSPHNLLSWIDTFSGMSCTTCALFRLCALEQRALLRFGIRLERRDAWLAPGTHD
jgi:hypothetical protein